jgi:hypothetical protein
MECFSSQANAPELPLGGFMPNDDPVLIKNIDGLGPVKAELTSTTFATGRGELYQGGSIGKRNIVLTLGFNPDWAGQQTMFSLRQLLYRYFLPQEWTKLRFYTQELPPVDIEGIVESFDPNIFSQDPEIQISILCHNPDFIDTNATIIEGVVDDGTIEQEFEYIGTADTGFELVVKHTTDNPVYTGNLIVLMRGQVFEVDPIEVDADQYFKLSTIPHAKRIQTVQYTDGALTNLLSGVSDISVWPLIKPGNNVLSVISSENDQSWTLAYFNRFAGL